MKRPIIVTVIAVISLVGSIFGFFSLLIYSSPELAMYSLNMVNISLPMLIALNILSNIINLTIGIGLLKRKEWSRKLLLYSYPILIVMGFFYMTEHIFLWVSIFLYLIYVYFLNQKVVLDYFRGVEVEEINTKTELEDQESISTVRKIFAVISLIIGGYFLLMTSFVFAVPVEGLMVKLIIVGIFGIISLAFFIAGLFLWGIKRWHYPSATVLISCGSLIVLIGIYMYLILHSSFAHQLPESSIEMFNSYTMLNIVFYGLILFFIGLFFFLYRRKEESKLA